MSRKRALSSRVVTAQDATPAVNGTKSEPKSITKRVTFLLSGELDTLIELYCSGSGEQKNVVARKAIIEYLSRHQQKLQEAVDASQRSMDRLIRSPSTRRRQE